MDIPREAARRLEHFDRRRPDPDAVVVDPEHGYAIQAEVARLRQRRGETVIGYKVGCTSPATQRQLGIAGPIFGRLFETERWPSGALLPRERFPRLAIEGELAVRLGRALPAEADESAVWAAVNSVFAVIELHHFPYRRPGEAAGPTAAELIASNGIHGGFVFADDGAEALDAGPASLLIEIDGREAASVSGTVSGTELTDTVASSLAWLARELPSRGERLRRGDIVLCGTVAPLLPAPEGRKITVTTDRFGTVECTLT